MADNKDNKTYYPGYPRTVHGHGGRTFRLERPAHIDAQLEAHREIAERRAKQRANLDAAAKMTPEDDPLPDKLGLCYMLEQAGLGALATRLAHTDVSRWADGHICADPRDEAAWSAAEKPAPKPRATRKKKGTTDAE